MLVYPVAATSLQEPTGLILAFLCALSWAAGTIYMKAIRIEGDLLAVTMWQIVVGVMVFGLCYLIVEGPPTFEPLQWRTWRGVVYSGIFGTALAYFIWYNIIGKVSTATASLGTLANPVIGVIGSVILLGERLTIADIVGFALIFAAAACVLLQPRSKPPAAHRIASVTPKQRLDDVTRAKLLLVLCGVCWGLMWPMIKIGLSGLSPWSFRLIGFTVGALTLMAVVKLTGRSLAVPGGMTAWMHLFVSSVLNVVAFGLFSTFAMLTASTGRVAVVSYSFPVWACLLAWLILGEKLRGTAALGLALCIAGLAVLVYPVIGSAAVIGLGLSLASAMTWAVGTIYLKLVRIPGDLIANTAWQVAIAAGVLLVLHTDLPGLADVRARSRQRRWSP